MNQNNFNKRAVGNCEKRDSQVQVVKNEFSRAKSYAAEYHQNKTPIAHFFNTRLTRVSELLNDFQSGRVLDVGCGPGKVGNMFRGKSVEYCGVDVSEHMIKECIDTFDHDPHFQFVLGRIEELPFRDSYFNVVLCLGAFEYVLDGHVAMQEIVRVLKPKGIVIVSMLSVRSPYRVWQNHVYSKFKNGISRFVRLIEGMRDYHDRKISRQESKRPKARLYSEKDFQNLMRSAGLEIEDIVYYDFNVFFSPLDVLFPRSSVFLSRKMESLCRSRLKSLGTGYILKSRNN